MGVIKNIMVRAVADFSQLTAASRRAQDSMRGMSDSMNRSLRGLNGGAISALAGGLGGIADQLLLIAGIGFGMDYLKEATSDAITFDARMQTLNERMGASSVQFKNWADTVGKSMGLSKMQIAEYGNTYSNMLLDASSSEQDLADKTAKLLQASAIIRSKTGLSQMEVSQRVRSAMNQEADGADELGINVRTTAVEASKAFKQIANGATEFAKLNSGMQKSIMLQYILDETTRRYGDTLANNASTKTAIFTASLSNLKLSMGQAFLPIWTTVLPSLSAMISWMDTAIQKVGMFIRIMLGYSATDSTGVTNTNKQTDAVKKQADAIGALGDAKKKAAGGVAGFDQVNTLPDKDKDGASGAGGAVPVGGAGGVGEGLKAVAPDTTAMEASVKAFADKVKGWIDGVKTSLDGISNWFKDHSDIIISALAGIAFAFAVVFGPGAVAGIAVWGASMVRWLWAIIPEAWAAAAAFIAMNLPIVLIIATCALLGFGIAMLIIHWKEVKKWALDSWDGIWKKTKEVGTWIGDKFNDMIKAVSDWGFALGKKAAEGYDNLCLAFAEAGKWFKENVIDPIAEWFTGWATDVGTTASTAWTNVCNAFKAAGEWFKTNVIDKIVEKFGDLTTGTKEVAGKAWEAVKTAFSTAGTWFTENVVDPIKTALGKITDGLGSGLVTAFSFVYNKVAGYLNDLIGKWNGIVGGNPLTSGLTMGFSVPYLAKGGITSGPQLAVVGDNPGGQEVIAPLDRLTGLVATAVTQAMAFSQPSRSSAPQGDIILNIDGRTFARIALPYLNQETSRTGNVMITTI